MKVIVAEKDRTINLMLKVLLQKEGIKVLDFFSGEGIKEAIEKGDVDCVVCNLILPGYSGLEIISMIRDELKLSTRIIVLSKIGLNNKINEAMKIGANEYVQKPIDYEYLLGQIKKGRL